MQVLAVGVNHRSADVALLERLAVAPDQLPKALADITRLEHVLEAVVLSTCNRVEVYAHVTRFHQGLQELRGWFTERADIHPQDFDGVHYSHHEEGVALHLFGVAAGIDSMVIGERQIASQVRQAVAVAREEDAAGRVLDKLFREAARVSRRARRETGIDKGASSIVEVGLRIAAGELGGLGGRTVLIIGAGTVGSLAAARLGDHGADQVLVWNRTAERARRLAGRTGGRVVRRGDLAEAVRTADLVVCTTGATTPVLDTDLVAAAASGRRCDLVLLDLGVPRNVAPGCAGLAGVRIVDMESVREVTAGTVESEAIDAVRAIVADEAGRFVAWMRAVEVEPAIKALRRHGQAVRRAELERHASRLRGLDERQREAVESLAHGIVNTLLHDPTVRLKLLADRGAGQHYASALRELFDLDA